VQLTFCAASMAVNATLVDFVYMYLLYVRLSELAAA
jgi:hypothetical protein